MPLSLQNDTTFSGPALPDPFVRLQLEPELTRLRLLPRTAGEDGRTLTDFWRVYRSHLKLLVSQGGPIRVRNQTVEPLLVFAPFGYTNIVDAPEIATREGSESGGFFLNTANGIRLRCWTAPLDEDLDAPARRGEAYRFSHARVASRVLMAAGERIGILTNGAELRILICDPARLDTTIAIAIDSSWKRQREVPDSFRLFIALACPDGVKALPDLLEKARLQQQKVTKDLRVQARLGVRDFIQAILDHPENRSALDEHRDKDALARSLWREGLVTVYRLLFILKVESTDDPAKALGFASGSLWRNTFSPTIALAPLVRATLDRGELTGRLLEDGMRNLFRLFSEGIECTEMTVRPMGGDLFDPEATPFLSRMLWGELAVAHLLDHLLWTEPRRGANARERVHYGPLDVEDLGKVYEALLELDPGIADEPMCRLRRAKLEVVVPDAQGNRYRAIEPAFSAVDEEESTVEDDAAQQSATKVEWIEEIRRGSFFLRVGLGRKATGSYYTPESFVRFLVQDTLGPLVDKVSPRDDPQPTALLHLKVVDEAMGSGHFLVGAARYLGDRLYEACRRCDELASEAERKLEHQELKSAERDAAQRQLDTHRKRLGDLPDPDQEVIRYLPSRVLEGVENGYSQRKAISLCRRLIAVHCLYGVDRNPLAVELAKLSLWIECHAEGLPLTFLDHRLVLGDSLTGPFFEQLLKLPISDEPLDDLFSIGLCQSFTTALEIALSHVRELEVSAGVTLAEVEAKYAAKERLDRALAPFKLVAAAWAGGVMLGAEQARDAEYLTLVRSVADTGHIPTLIQPGVLLQMISKGLGGTLSTEITHRGNDLENSLDGFCPALPYDLSFPEVFYPSGRLSERSGFHAAIGNPPWEGIDTSNKEFFASFDFSILELTDDREINALIERLMVSPIIAHLRESYESEIEGLKRTIRRSFEHVNQGARRESAATPDLYQCFAERTVHVLQSNGRIGLVLPSAFHSNEGAAGIRRLILDSTRLETCFSFENRRALFDIHRSFKFATVVAETGHITVSFACRFYLHDDEWLFSPRRIEEQLTYSRDFIRLTTGESQNFLELRDRATVPIAETMYRSKLTTFGALRSDWNVFPTEELHTSKQRFRTSPLRELASTVRGDPRLPGNLSTLISLGIIPVCKGEHFHQFDSSWGDSPDVGTTVDRMKGKEVRLLAASYYRLVFRRQASSTNERTVIAHMTEPGLLFFDSALPERDGNLRQSWKPLTLVGLVNSFPFDWIVRQLVSANITFNFLDTVPVPSLETIKQFIAHSTLRLSSTHSGYLPLWNEQLGDNWREIGLNASWPVLPSSDNRWSVRSAIDAVIAQAYGLNREQYAHVLGTFSHSSYFSARDLCLERFDELSSRGLDYFIRRHDPYFDVPLNESLPRPVIVLTVPTAATVVSESHQREFTLDSNPAVSTRRRDRRQRS